ncbi:MAG: DNA polymerase IV [Spartobacteria bacterium]|nr:DNA polymerase IV [Spartobacteria bacterium]
MQKLMFHSSYPNAVMHFDGDAFFTSVEQSVHPELKGRPVVTGKERGIIACASYEAKALGIKRGVSLWEARKMCPELVVLPSDYETYSIYSKRMFEIARRYTPMVEEYSIDEGFADLTGLRRLHHMSYPDIARRIQREICEELDLGVSVGLGLSKGLAKLASKFRKPLGFTAVGGAHVELFLQRHTIDQVWGIGPNSASMLRKHGVNTPYDFIQRPEAWVKKMMGKVGDELWHELRGHLIHPVDPDEKKTYASISKGKTFTSPSSDPDFIYAKLVRNVESAFIKMRRYKLRARKLVVVLRWQDYRQDALEARLNRPTASTQEVLPIVRDLFERLLAPGDLYRTTMVVLTGLEEDRCTQMELFEDRLRIERLARAARVVDQINQQYGKHTVHVGSSLFLEQGPKTDRDVPPARRENLLKGENARQRLRIPRMGLEV